MTNPSLSHIAPATLHLVCGKIGAGKSTLCAKLAEQPATVLISEDSWLATLYPGEVAALTDYVRCSSRLKTAMAEHVQALLKAGVSVVLDFPSNTLAGTSLRLDFALVKEGVFAPMTLVFVASTCFSDSSSSAKSIGSDFSRPPELTFLLFTAASMGELSSSTPSSFSI